MGAAEAAGRVLPDHDQAALLPHPASQIHAEAKSPAGAFPSDVILKFTSYFPHQMLPDLPSDACRMTTSQFLREVGVHDSYFRAPQQLTVLLLAQAITSRRPCSGSYKLSGVERLHGADIVRAVKFTLSLSLPPSLHLTLCPCFPLLSRPPSPPSPFAR